MLIPCAATDGVSKGATTDESNVSKFEVGVESLSFMSGVKLLSPAQLTVELIASFVESDIEPVTTDVKALFKSNSGNKVEKLRPDMIEFLKFVPHDENGLFSEPSARYAVHTFFFRRYGWQLAGFSPAGKLWNSSSIMKSSILESGLPGRAKSVMTERLAAGALTADEIVALAAIVELLMDAEAVGRFRVIFHALGLPLNGTLGDDQVSQILNWYIGLYLPGKPAYSNSTKAAVQSIVEESQAIYPEFDKIASKASDLYGLTNAGIAGQNATFSKLASVCMEIGYSIGSWQMSICGGLKDGLMKLQANGTGRIFLSDFYRASVEDGMWEFGESAEYMKQFGALDETIPGEPRVITSNWIWGPSNCMVTSITHDACCISECESIRSHVEKAVAAPVATVDKLVDIVSKLPSSTRPAVGSLSPELMSKLRSLAITDGGSVPIYGRLFLQWLHHVYPNECPFPQLAGTTEPETIFKYEAEHEGRSEVGFQEIAKSLISKRRRHAPLVSAPWLGREELVATSKVEHPVLGVSAIRLMVLFASMNIALYSLARTTSRATSLGFQKAQKNVPKGMLCMDVI